MITKIKTLKSIRCAGGEVQRHLVSIDGLTIVLLSKSHPILRPSLSTDAWKRFANESELPVELAELVDQWNRSLRFSYNCHLLAIGSAVGLTTSDWVEGSAGRHTLLQNPAHDLLKTFFERVSSDPSCDCAAPQHDDVIVIRSSTSGDLVHSGRIWKRDSKTFVVSKIGEHPVAATSLAALETLYGTDEQVIEIYRRRASTEAPEQTETRHSRRPPTGNAHRRKTTALPQESA